MGLIRNDVKNINGGDSVGDFVQRSYGRVSVSLRLTRRNIKIYQVKHIYYHPIPVYALCLIIFFGWFYYSRRNKTQFDTLYVSKQIDTYLFTLSVAKYFRFNTNYRGHFCFLTSLRIRLISL